tara:strand:+ start:3544 stop:4011 length:468 start_codon:yes stop_codon:yes gene_type:complete
MFLSQNKRDNFYTHKATWQLIKEYIPKDKLIWECFYGDGKSGQYLTELGCNVIHKDIDFFENNLGEIIVSNPPFSLRKKVFERLKELDKPFIILMFPIVLSCKWFLDIGFNDKLQIIIPKTRVKCYGNGHKNYSPNGGLWYFCYKMNLPKDLIII